MDPADRDQATTRAAAIPPTDPPFSPYTGTNPMRGAASFQMQPFVFPSFGVSPLMRSPDRRDFLDSID